MLRLAKIIAVRRLLINDVTQILRLGEKNKTGYQIYVRESLTVLVNRIFITMWIYKQISFCNLFFTKVFFSVVCKLRP